MIKYLLIIGLGCISGMHTTAQNLVKNPGFEAVEKCPKFWSEKPSDLTAKHWESPTQATPDNFMTCSKISGIPQNWAGIIHAHAGKAYAGFIARRNFGKPGDDPKRTTHREYLQGELIQPLAAGHLYEFGMWVSLAENCRMATDQIQCVFTQKRLKSQGRSVLAVEPQFSTPAGKVISTRGSWVYIKGVFKAKGGEQYLTIGNFSTNKGKKYENVYRKIRNNGKAFQFSYYYVDDVKLIPFEQDKKKKAAPLAIGKIKKEQQWNYQTFQGKAFVANSGKSKKKARDLTCLCKVCTEERNGTLFPEIALDQLDSTTFRVGQVVGMDKMVFDLKSTHVEPETYAELRKLAFLLREMPSLEVELVLHMDAFGKADENKEISGITFWKVENYLRSKGVRNKLLYNGFGKTVIPPLNGRQRDRILELVIRKI